MRRHLPLARRLARRYHGSGDSVDDLVQVASIGLLKAIERFDPERGVKFATFAVPTILGELKRHIRDFGWAVHVSRAEQERALRVRCIEEELTGRSGRSATPAEIAAAAGLSAEEVLEARETASAARPTSLDGGEGGDDEHGGDYLLDRMSTGPGDFELVESRDRIARCLRGLSAREREVVFLRFAADLTQAQIGAQIGVSQMQVSRILRRALDHSRALAEGPARRRGA